MKIAYADMWGKSNPIQSFRLAGLDKPIYCAASTTQGNSPASEGRKNDAAAGAACGAGPIAALKLQELEPVRKRVQLFDIA